VIFKNRKKNQTDRRKEKIGNHAAGKTVVEVLMKLSKKRSSKGGLKGIQRKGPKKEGIYYCVGNHDQPMGGTDGEGENHLKIRQCEDKGKGWDQGKNAPK